VAGGRQASLEHAKNGGFVLDRQNVHRAECTGGGLDP
jgi:hypothetical protein